MRSTVKQSAFNILPTTMSHKHHKREQQEQRLSTGILLSDIKNAFDSVWHEELLYKLGLLNFLIYLI